MKSFREYIQLSEDEAVPVQKVAPRPTAAGQTQRRWDQFYGATNNPDGTPKQGATVQAVQTQKIPAQQPQQNVMPNPSADSKTQQPAQQNTELPGLIKQIQGLVDPKLLGPTGADSKFGVNTAKAILAKLQPQQSQQQSQLTPQQQDQQTPQQQSQQPAQQQTQQQTAQTNGNNPWAVSGMSQQQESIDRILALANIKK